ncbi:hypothetical protein B566_EDAN012974 [Ephemera danica]|nr:hypothetical protein B566_EDAN012974 [Ephemera danica]
MNVVEENVTKTLPSLDISAARKRRRQKRLKPLKTPDRLDIVEYKDDGASPEWSISPVSTLDESHSYLGAENGSKESALLAGPAYPAQMHTPESSNSKKNGSRAGQNDEIQNIEDTNNVSDVIQMGSTVMKHSNENLGHSEGFIIAASTTTMQSAETLLEPVEPVVKKVKHKKINKRKKSKETLKLSEDVSSNATTISAALNEIIDTVEVVDENHPPSKPPRTSLSRHSGLGSEISLISDGRVFVQHGRSFTVTPRDKAFVRTSSLRENSSSQQSSTTALSMAIAYQKKFLPLSAMCHGLLAGIVIWQCITVFRQNGNDSTLSFVESYSKVARVFQAVFYILATISCVAVLDRCVPSSFSWQGLWELLMLQPCCLFALLASCGALLTSGIAAKLDDRLALHSFNDTLWPDSEVSDHHLNEWLTTNLVRCVLAVASYLIISLCWGDNSRALPFPEMSASVKPSSSVA